MGVPLGEILQTLARSRSLEILFALEKRELKFNEIVEIAGNTTTAMRRVKELQDTGLISRKVLQDIQRSVEYSLARKGQELIHLVKKMLELEKRR